ncbi:MAG: serine/threonine-protein kinase [Labilithrix sp.]
MPTDPKALVCPKCRTTWAETEAPGVCPNDGASLVRAKELAAAQHDPMVGRVLENRYTITARLGSGSMGTVYRAKQHAMGREVAIKILRGDRAIDDSAKARFLREARANSLLASPNTVTVFDFGQSESGEFYLAMELLEGESLGQRLSRIGRIPVPQAVDCARQALRSLSEAHAKGIIHRDLKPDNIFFARMLTSATASNPTDGHEEIVKVLDFGIAKMMRGTESGMIAEMDAVETQVGTVFGTPRYMSPEQAQGKPLDPRTDLYSLGVILYQMVTGRPPFTDTDAVVVMARHIKSVPKRPNEAVPEAAVPKELEDVIMRSLAKTPEERQGSADIFAGELLAALEAQSSITSGVRASITNVAGIRVPDSLRPPPVTLPPPPVTRRSGLSLPVLGALGALVVAVAASGVYYGMSHRKKTQQATSESVPPPPPATTPSAVPPPPPPVPSEPATAAAPTAPPVESAKPATSATPSTSSKHPPKRPKAAPAAPAPANNTTAPATAPATHPPAAPTPSYGVFE